MTDIALQMLQERVSQALLFLMESHMELNLTWSCWNDSTLKQYWTSSIFETNYFLSSTCFLGCPGYSLMSGIPSSFIVTMISVNMKRSHMCSASSQLSRIQFIPKYCDNTFDTTLKYYGNFHCIINFLKFFLFLKGSGNCDL